MNQALPPVPGIPRDHPSGRDSGDIDQKLVKQGKQYRVGRWVGVHGDGNISLCFPPPALSLLE